MRSNTIKAAVIGSIVAVGVGGSAFAQGPGRMYDDDHHGPWMAFFLFLIVATIAIVGLVLALNNRRNAPVAPVATPPASNPTASAEALLAERLARGEINPDDYRTTLAALRGEPGPTRPAQ